MNGKDFMEGFMFAVLCFAFYVVLSMLFVD